MTLPTQINGETRWYGVTRNKNKTNKKRQSTMSTIFTFLLQVIMKWSQRLLLIMTTHLEKQ